MLFAATRVNLDHFVRDLANGDPVVWGILIAMVGFTAFGIYQKYRAFSRPSYTETELE